ncbi:acyl-CoA dehydrogenase family protein [Desmospora profundinema]|uniref:Alkylation response protein AidB-like acyl-CoA dehydrogenase n=1 Tax=Desmospora profundinema TaxID=1571184 RepID=A0ABU1IQ64_9BACL|nr:acyl-CoA dehydrogenase family protein [Desmospora profundinema]MDR6226548.1 alkylation response protein AidB-like acyl-CoA dehydrogenase [Desmospora profundinema]
MISYQPAEEERAFVNLARNFADERVRPMARECEQNRRVDPDLVKKGCELGFMALELPESWGGMEMPLISQVQILESLSFGDLAVVQGLPGPGDAASLIRLLPDSPVLKSYKNAGLDGCWPAVAFLHAADGVVPPTAKIKAVPQETGYVLSGTSQPLRLAAWADYLLIAVTDSEGEILILWLDKTHNRWHTVEGNCQLGLLAAGCARLHFDNEMVTQEQVLAKEREARDFLIQALARVHVVESAKEVGIMQAALSYAAEYTAYRKAFGQEIAKFQGVSFNLADMAIETQATRHLVWRSAVKIDGEGGQSAMGTLSRVHRSLRFVTDSAVQLLGGHGYVQEYPVEKWMRDAQAQIILYGREGDLAARRGEQILREHASAEV